MDARQLKGFEIAKDKRLKCKGALWLVPSQTHAGHYLVDPREGSCTCLDHETRAVKCKHQWAVAYVRHEVVHPDGSVETTEVMRVTHRQDWPQYNAAQCSEKGTVQALLRGLCEGIVQPRHEGRGRPPLPLADVVYGAAMKVYTGMSGRRATTDIRECQAKGHIDHAAHYNLLFAYLKREDLTPLLTSLIEASASPLAEIEHDFAVDATGFSTSTYTRWFDVKWGREVKRQAWVKAHASVGVKTNVIAAVTVTDGDSHDSPEMAGLVERTAERFTVAEVSGDKAYLSHANLAAIERVGAVPYISFKKNSKSDGSEAWRKMWLTYSLHRDEFLSHYHKRSNSETTFSAIKRKFGAAVRSKHFTAQVNEVLLKVLCYNLTVLTHSMRELGVDPGFRLPELATEQTG